jgi:hypothetical protein
VQELRDSIETCGNACIRKVQAVQVSLEQIAQRANPSVRAAIMAEVEKLRGVSTDLSAWVHTVPGEIVGTENPTQEAKANAKSSDTGTAKNRDKTPEEVTEASLPKVAPSAGSSREESATGTANPEPEPETPDTGEKEEGPRIKAAPNKHRDQTTG